jgi:formylglycine-generating enzyme required for sulfatase activity
MRNAIGSLGIALGLALVWTAGALMPAPALAEKRLALAVGIDTYDHLPAAEQLEKAVSDARAVGAVLAELGFDTAVEENVAKLAFTRAWQKFLNRLQPGDTAALFFAGHGVEVNGLNFLLPRDVPKVVPGEDRVLAEASIRLNTLMENLREKKVRVSLLIVDACRTNPFRDGAGRSVGGTRGLTRVEAAKGSFVMYSAGEGEEALDRLPGGADASPNSVYTRTLLPILRTPGLSLPEIATLARDKVVEIAQKAGREQTPAYYDRLVGKLVLNPGAKPAVKAESAPLSEAATAWAAVKDTDSIAQLEVIAKRYAGTVYAELARARIGELKDPQPEAGASLNPLRAAVPLTAAEERALKPGDSFRECSDCPEMVVVPAGSFTMGSPPEEDVRTEAEGPQRLVTIARPFAVGKLEVTFAEWDACVAEHGCKHKPGDLDWGRGGRPAIDVSWNDIAAEFLPWLSRKTGKRYRLLTEAEWEYAARAGTTTRYAFGDKIGRAQAHFSEHSWGQAGKTMPAGSFQPNPFGLYDMHGNVWEWVQDCWNETYDGAPSEGAAWTAGDCDRRVARGGSWYVYARDLRSAYRVSEPPDNRDNNMGFRVARTL